MDFQEIKNDLQTKFPDLFFRIEDNKYIRYSMKEDFSSSYGIDFQNPDWSIDVQNKNEESKLQKEFSERYPYLYFSILPDLKHTWLWMKDKTGRDGAAIRGGSFLLNDTDIFVELNKKGEQVSNSNGNLFYCTSCGEVRSKEEFFSSLWAGVYCKSCVNKDEELSKEIHRSKTDPRYFE